LALSGANRIIAREVIVASGRAGISALVARIAEIRANIAHTLHRIPSGHFGMAIGVLGA